MTPLCLLAPCVLSLLAPPQGFPVDDPRNARVTPEVLVVREVAPTVVYIEAQRPAHVGWNVLGQPVQGLRPVTGSGVMVESSGFIVTNYHVVGDDARKITVQFDPEHDAQDYHAELVSYVKNEDLALIKITGKSPFPVVRMGTSSDLMIGERVLAIGNPLRQRLTVSAGIISGLHRNLQVDSGGLAVTFSDLIQTDASINPGNSGGPLLNILGELVGINTAMNTSAENMGFAIPVDRVREVLQDHLLDPSASRAWLGFEVDEADSFCIHSVTPGGPAAAAGIREGDQLVALEDVPILTARDYHLRRLPILPNRPVRLRVRSDGVERTVDLVGWNKPDGVLFQRAGMTVERFVFGHASTVRILSVDASGPAGALGLKPGDVVDAVRVGETGQAWRLHRPEDFAALVAGLERGAQLWIDVLRDDNRNGLLEREEVYRGHLELR